MREFLRYLIEPADYAGQPYVWMVNQVGHAALGAVGFWVLAHVLAPVAAAVAVLAAYAAFEVWQHRRGGGAIDGLTDWAFVFAGVAWAHEAGSWPVLAGAITGLALGVSRRL